MSRNIYIFAGGGTGGHLYPGLSVAQQLKRQDPDSLAVFACSNRPIDQQVLGEYEHVIVPQVVKPVTKSPLKIPGFLHAWVKSLSQAKRLIADLKPRAVVGLGGFAAGPIVKIAADRKIPSALLNPDIIPGKANRYLAGKVDAIFTQFESTSQCFTPQIRSKVQLTGCPVRPELLEGTKARACEEFGLVPGRKTLLVFGGSTLAESISDAMSELAADFDHLAETWQILIATGTKKFNSVSRAFNARPVHTVVLEYCSKMDLAYAAADLAICRGGAGTVAELSATATPAIILPYPHHADRQQYKNSEDGQNQGRFIVLDDRSNPALNAQSLRGELFELLENADKLEAMKQRATGSAQAGAAREIASWMIQASR